MSNIQKRTFKETINSPEIKAKFEEMLGKRAPQFLMSVQTCVQNNDLLKVAEPNSIMFAAATAATLNMPVNPNLGMAYIIGYKKNNKDGTFATLAQFQLGWKGFVQLAIRSGQFKDISTKKVFEGQYVEDDSFNGFHFNWKNKQSDKVVGYASYFELLTGFKKILFMTVEELQEHGRKYSKTYGKGGLWTTDFDAMALKTVLKQLLSKYAPLSVEMEKAIATDQGTIGDWDAQDIEYPDNDGIPDAEVIVEQRASAVSSVASKLKSKEEINAELDREILEQDKKKNG